MHVEPWSALSILVAAEEATVRLAVRAVLEGCGFRVETAGTPAEATAKAEAGTFDLVLCHARESQAEACGLFLRYVRGLSYRPAAACLEATRESTAEQENDELFIEPVDVPRLLTQISHLLAGRAYGRDARRASEAAA